MLKRRSFRTGSGGERPKPYLTTPEEVTALLEALDSDDVMVKRNAAEQLRALGKNSNANRATIAAAGKCQMRARIFTGAQPNALLRTPLVRVPRNGSAQYPENPLWPRSLLFNLVARPFGRFLRCVLGTKVLVPRFVVSGIGLH